MLRNDLMSNLVPYSLGIVLEAKQRDSDMIKVSPIEHITLDNGQLATIKKEYNVSALNKDGVIKKDKVEGGHTLIAKWIPYGHSNRMSAPDVQPSETVVIYRYADTDEYYWTTIFREPNLRRLETVNYSYGNLPTGINSWDKNTSYWWEVSTHDKYIKLHTSKNDGEPFAYDIILDTKKATLLITDNSGNSIFLESTPSKLTINTNEDIILNTKRVTINASESIIDNTARSITNATEFVLEKTPLVEHDTPLVHNTKDVITDGVDTAHPNANAVH